MVGARRSCGTKGMRFPKVPEPKKRKKHSPSIIQPKDGGCYLCQKLHDDYTVKRTEEHHVYFGRGQRAISEANGFKVHLCRKHHTHNGGPEAVHRNHEICLLVQQDVQRAFEKTHSREEFVKLIGKNYLD